MVQNGGSNKKINDFLSAIRSTCSVSIKCQISACLSQFSRCSNKEPSQQNTLTQTAVNKKRGEKKKHTHTHTQKKCWTREDNCILLIVVGRLEKAELLLFAASVLFWFFLSSFFIFHFYTEWQELLCTGGWGGDCQVCNRPVYSNFVIILQVHNKSRVGVGGGGTGTKNPG